MIPLLKVLELLEQVAPESWAEPWDNVGLQVGDRHAPVRRIAVALDISEESLALAEERGCDLLISHHPLLFAPIKTLPLDSSMGKIIARAVRTAIGLVSLHTNWDSAPEGVNSILADRLGLSGIQPLEVADNGSWGMGAVGHLPEGLFLPDFVDMLRDKWNLTWAKGYIASEERVRKIALCGGSGGSLVPQALSHHADLFVTADMKYHQIEEALRLGLSLCLVDHGEMESVSLASLASAVGRATKLPVDILDIRTLPVPYVSADPAVPR